MKCMRSGLGLVAAALVLGGCADWDEGYEDGSSGWWMGGEVDAPPVGRWDGTGNLGVELIDGWLEGDLGAVQGFAGEATRLETFGSTLMVETEGRGWAAMAFVEVQGDLAAPDAVVGVGCSGPASGEWEYDVPAEQVELAYLPAQGEEPGRVDIVLHFPDGGTTSARVNVR